MSKPGSASKIKLNSLDTLFGNTETSKDIDSSKEQVIEVPLTELYTFKNHPFSVKDDDKMQETVDSIKERGVLVPGIVRKRISGGYELISGHRRKRACELAGLKTMPVFVRNLTDDEAIIVMVDSNIQREEILPSEKAKAYKMKYEALKHQGKSGSGQSLELMAKEAGESRATIQRYVAVADMEPELLDMMDEKKLGLTQAVNLSSLSSEEQVDVSDVIRRTEVSPTKEQSAEIKKLSKEGNLSKETVNDVLIQNIKESKSQKKKSRRVVLNEELLSEFFEENITENEIIDIVKELLEKWKINH